MVDPEVARSETVGGSPYGGWATLGLGFAVGVVFTVVQTIVASVLLRGPGAPPPCDCS